uniref:Uncharacterized protein n=1 Tax=Rhinopithecus roxellana TaxID=61622 RepID=A0A2K6P9T5_RHIRO
MTDKTEKVAVDRETSFVSEKQKMALLARKQGAEDSLTAGSAMSKEKKLKTRHCFPSSQLDSQIDDFAGFSKDGLMQKPDSNAPVGGIITSNLSGDDLKCREIFPFPKSQEEINADIKCPPHDRPQCVMFPFPKYEKIFKFLEGVQGPIEVEKRFFESIFKQ